MEISGSVEKHVKEESLREKGNSNMTLMLF